MFNIKFCYKLGKTATETHGMFVQVYEREFVIRKCVYDWFKGFREGKETTEDGDVQQNPGNDRESATNFGTRSATVCKVVCGEIAHYQGHGAHHRPRRFGAARFVPHKLSDEQKARRMDRIHCF